MIVFPFCCCCCVSSSFRFCFVRLSFNYYQCFCSYSSTLVLLHHWWSAVWLVIDRVEDSSSQWCISLHQFQTKYYNEWNKSHSHFSISIFNIFDAIISARDTGLFYFYKTICLVLCSLLFFWWWCQHSTSSGRVKNEKKKC